MLNQFLRYDGGGIAEAHQTEGATGGANGEAVLGQHIEADEQVARKEGLNDLVPTPAASSGGLDPGQESVEALPP